MGIVVPQIAAREVVHLRLGRRVGVGTKSGTTVCDDGGGLGFAAATTTSGCGAAIAFSRRITVFV